MWVLIFESETFKSHFGCRWTTLHPDRQKSKADKSILWEPMGASKDSFLKLISPLAICNGSIAHSSGLRCWGTLLKWKQYRKGPYTEPTLLLLLLRRFSRVRLCATPRRQPPGSPVPGLLQARTLEWVAISFSSAGKWKVKVKSLSRVRLFETPWTAAHQAPPSMGFFRREY